MTDWTDEQLRALKAEHAPKATDGQWKVYLAWCRARGLDPFSGLVRLEVRNWQDKQGRWHQSATPMTHIDGYRALAVRSGDLNGQDGPYWCGPDGAWRDVWLEKGPPAAAKVTVFRRSCAHPFVGVARFDEYEQPKGPMWRKMPALMVAKVAEALALRKAFPEDLSGLYTDDEMDQAREPLPDPSPQPNAQPKGEPKRIGRQVVRDGVPEPDMVALDKCADAAALQVWCANYGAGYHVMDGAPRDTVRKAMAATSKRLGVDMAEVKTWLGDSVKSHAAARTAGASAKAGADEEPLPEPPDEAERDPGGFERELDQRGGEAA